jgi:DNA-binding LacI/PurR family transcriptional regulator
MAGGWTNAFFTKIFSGVEQACRERGYGMHASLYNLTNVDSFVFPAKVGQRSVDGLVLTGYVEAAVVARFREFGVPCVCIGDNLEVAELIATVADDMISGILQALEYLAGLGHVQIGYCPGPTRRGLELGNMIIRRAASHPKTSHCRIKLLEFDQWADYNLAPVLLETWLGTPRTDRPTAIMASDQTLVGFLKEMNRKGLACPRNISLVAGGNTCLCEYSIPGLTAIDCDLEGMGRTAVNMLLDHLENKISLSPAVSRNDFPDRLVVRESCGPPSLEHN